LSSEALPNRDQMVNLAGSIGVNAAVLAMGFAIGVLWVGTSVQATGCVSGAGVRGACKVLPVVEQAANYALLAVGVGFAVAFGVEYRNQEADE